MTVCLATRSVKLTNKAGAVGHSIIFILFPAKIFVSTTKTNSKAVSMRIVCFGTCAILQIYALVM